MQKMSRVGTDILLIIDDKKKLLGVLTDKIVTRFILKGGNINDPLEVAMIKDPITAKTTD